MADETLYRMTTEFIAETKANALRIGLRCCCIAHRIISDMLGESETLGYNDALLMCETMMSSSQQCDDDFATCNAQLLESVAGMAWGARCRAMKRYADNIASVVSARTVLVTRTCFKDYFPSGAERETVEQCITHHVERLVAETSCIRLDMVYRPWYTAIVTPLVRTLCEVAEKNGYKYLDPNVVQCIVGKM
jgi:hypothetical protein